MTRIGQAPPCSDRPVVEIYQNITYNSSTPNDSLAAEDICPKLLSMGVPIAAVIPTFDPATYLANRLAECVGARGNPFEGPLAHARFDKWAMSEAVRKAGLRAVKERLVSTWTEAKDFLESLNPPLSHAKPVIFKLLQSSNSQGVTKVYNLQQAEVVFKKAVGSTTGYGDKVEKVLIQEFLQGKEYVVDSVSRDGVHKTVVVWHEDLRPGNGYFNLYYGFKIMDPEDDKIRAIIDYANKVLTATGVQNGASDMEVFWVEDEGAPCVTDLNARWTALMWNNGLDMENTITGNNQITATVNALLDGVAFNQMPSVPVINKHGAIIFALPHHTGIITAVPGMEVVKKLPSYVKSMNEGLVAGKVINKLYNSHPTVYVELAHKDKAVLDKDYDFIIGLEYSNHFFEIAPVLGHMSPLQPLHSKKSPTALRHTVGGLQGHWQPAVIALAMVTVSAVCALVAMSWRKVRDDTEYSTIE